MNSEFKVGEIVWSSAGGVYNPMLIMGIVDNEHYIVQSLLSLYNREIEKDEKYGTFKCFVQHYGSLHSYKPVFDMHTELSPHFNETNRAWKDRVLRWLDRS